jgi:hypothetical protein
MSQGRTDPLLHLEPGTPVEVYEYGNVICIARRAAEPIDAAFGILPASPSLAEELMRDRDEDRRR